MREDVLLKMEKNRLLKRLLTDEHLGHKNVPYDILASKKDDKAALDQYMSKLMQKKEALLSSLSMHDKAINFPAQMINPIGSIYGDVIISPKFVAFISCGLCPEVTDENRYRCK